jgi:hypothetical protein
MVFKAIKDFFRLDPEEPVELNLDSMLSSQFSKFKNIYGVDLGGTIIQEDKALYSVYPSQDFENIGIVNLRCKTYMSGSYEQDYDLPKLGMGYSEFEKKVTDYFTLEHPRLKRESI